VGDGTEDERGGYEGRGRSLLSLLERLEEPEFCLSEDSERLKRPPNREVLFLGFPVES